MWEEVEEAQLKGGAGGSGSGAAPRKKLSIKIPKWCGKWVVSMDEYKDGVVGAKSKNLAGARGSFVPCSSCCAVTCCIECGTGQRKGKLGNLVICRLIQQEELAILQNTAE